MTIHAPRHVSRTPARGPVPRLLRALVVLVGAAAFTLLFFLVLPLMQAIAKPPSADLTLASVDAVLEPPPPPPVEEEPEEEEPEEEETPELQDEAPPLDLSALEIALNPGMGGGMGGASFEINIGGAGAGSDEESEALFSSADLDQRPRVIYQPGPNLTAALRRRGGGRVIIIFVVDEQGRVQTPIVQQSTDPAFEGPALAAVKQWRFEPGKRNGEPVRFRMQVPITFPEG